MWSYLHFCYFWIVSLVTQVSASFTISSARKFPFMDITEDITSPRFIVLGTARSGTNLLLTLLNAHKSVKMYGELFNLDTLTRDKLDKAVSNPVEYLQEYLYPTDPHGNTAIGFKIFYDHMTFDYFQKIIPEDVTSEALHKRFSDINGYIGEHYSQQYLDTKFRSAWDFLISNKRLKVIHLKRENKLKTLVSLKIAYITNKWMHWKPEELEKATCRLEYEECVSYFTKMSNYEQSHDCLFGDHEKLVITYEELVKQQDQTINQCWDFLQLPHSPVNTILKKQNSDRLEDTLINYEELKNTFEGSPWRIYFDQ